LILMGLAFVLLAAASFIAYRAGESRT
jgi:hypothetical protein